MKYYEDIRSQNVVDIIGVCTHSQALFHRTHWVVTETDKAVYMILLFLLMQSWMGGGRTLPYLVSTPLKDKISRYQQREEQQMLLPNSTCADPLHPKER